MSDRAIEWITVTTSKLGVSRTLTTVAGLAEFLLVECDDPAAIPAKQACLDALEGFVPPEEARAAFAEAVVQAGYYIIEPYRPEPTGMPDPVWRKKRKRRS